MNVLIIPEDFRNDQYVLQPIIEAMLKAEFAPGCRFFAENAWQELEVWLLAGHDLPREWSWQEIRQERDPKERYFVPFAKSRGYSMSRAEGANPWQPKLQAGTPAFAPCVLKTLRPSKTKFGQVSFSR